MKTLLSLTSLFLSSSVFAVGDFSGHWVGEGQIASNIGLNGTCSKIEIIITQTADKLVTEKYESTCNILGSSWGPIDMILQGGDVFEDGEQVGTINDDTLLTMQPDGSINYAFNLKLIPQPDGSVQLMTYYGTQNAIGAIATEGLLKKATR